MNVTGDAFALTLYKPKPYALQNQIPGQRNFNYRLSRARGTVENAFGQMSQCGCPTSLLLFTTEYIKY